MPRQWCHNLRALALGWDHIEVDRVAIRVYRSLVGLERDRSAAPGQGAGVTKEQRGAALNLERSSLEPARATASPALREIVSSSSPPLTTFAPAPPKRRTAGIGSGVLCST